MKGHTKLGVGYLLLPYINVVVMKENRPRERIEQIYSTKGRPGEREMRTKRIGCSKDAQALIPLSPVSSVFFLIPMSYLYTLN